MNISKTFNNKNFNNKSKPEFSKTNFGNFYQNSKLKKNLFFYGNFNSFSSDFPARATISQNNITNKILQNINKVKSSKLIQDKNIVNHIENFHTEVIKLKIRKNKKYQSLFDKIDLSTPNVNLYQSPKLKKMQKNLINLKIRANKNKIFNHNLENNKNSIYFSDSRNVIKEKESIKNIKTSSSLMDKNISSQNNKISDDISKTHFTTWYIPNNKIGADKSLSSIHKNKNYILNTDSQTNKQLYEEININEKNNFENNKNILNTDILNDENNLNTIQSFITSINYIQTPPLNLEFREQNLQNFYFKTRDLRYTKYFLFLKKNKLKKTKETIELRSILRNIDNYKLIRFYKLFKPYYSCLEKYLIFLKEEINNEKKINQKLIIKKNEVLTEFLNKRRRLLKMHQKLKAYLNDKFFLLCVKNSTLKMELFDEKDQFEFEQDLKIFKILKKYVDELSEINFNESFKDIGRKTTLINKYLKSTRKTTKINCLNDHSRNNSKKNLIKKNTEKYSINILKISGIRFKPKPIFESIEEFYDYIKSSRTRIEHLLMEDNKISIEVANLRDYYLLHQKDINKSRYNKLLLQNKFNKMNQELLDIKAYNVKLEAFKNDIIKKKKKKTFKKVLKKITEILNNIYELYNTNINQFIKKYNIDKPILALTDLEKVIIYLINFNNAQKRNNRQLYNEKIKKIEKNKRLAIIKQKREEDEHKNERKCQELIEKDLKILNINNRRININYKRSNNKNKKKEENVDENKDSVDISY